MTANLLHVYTVYALQDNQRTFNCRQVSFRWIESGWTTAQ